MGQALYRKYRSKSLDEIVGQEHITKTLKNALNDGKISHAYLLTGPRGVGKTSIARILAHEVNNLPYDEDTSHLDIIEIDAASNRGIEEIRDLREKVHIAPTSAKYKVYIIDEVHMLTKQAFNALLKTLEEPPQHAIFILATTESHKLPETIISRTQRYTFKPIEQKRVVDHLSVIASQENIKVDNEALELIAQHGGGSFRDSISLLDQASSSAKVIKEQDILRLLGIPPEKAIKQLVSTMFEGTARELLDLLSELRYQGFQAGMVAKQLGNVLRSQLVDGQIDMPAADLTSLLQQLIAVPTSNDPDGMLEIVLLGVNLQRGAQMQAQPKTTMHISPVLETIGIPAGKAQDNPAATDSEAHTGRPSQKPKDDLPPASDAQPSVHKSSDNNPDAIAEVWPEVLTTIKKRHNTLYSILRMAQPRLDKDSLILSFGFAFHQKKINEEKTRLIVSEVVAQLLGQPVAVVCVVEKNKQPPQVTVAVNRKSPAANTESGALDTISNIFGGGEVLE